MSLHVWDIFKDRNTFGLCVFPPRLSTRRMEALINITFQIVYFLACILMSLLCVWYFAWFAVRQSLVGESPPPKKKSREELIGEAYVIATLWINSKVSKRHVIPLTILTEVLFKYFFFLFPPLHLNVFYPDFKRGLLHFPWTKVFRKLFVINKCYNLVTFK